MRLGFVLILILSLTWLLLSGYFTPMLLTLGAISVALVMWICYRMRILDAETIPYLTTLPTLSYLAWLFGEIVKANMQVVRAVLRPAMEVTPTATKIPLTQHSDIARSLFGNSITLTPGTVSVDMEEDFILVHALLEEMSHPQDFVEMSSRSAWAMGDKFDEGEVS